MIAPLEVDAYRHIFILTGAGISAGSGLPTFRGQTGPALNGPDVMWISDARNLPGSLPQVWELYGGLRVTAAGAQPNAAHRAIAELQRRRAPGSVSLVTQNVDGLHQRAGSLQVYELHGSAQRTRCTDPRCTLAPFAEDTLPDPLPPPCPRCGVPLRPDLVLFNEPIPPDVLEHCSRVLPVCDLFVAVGTSGTVSPAADFVYYAAQAGARTVLVNLEAMSPPNPFFAEEYLGPAEETLPQLLR